jgi:predicted phage terminase large subunit-like protein
VVAAPAAHIPLPRLRADQSAMVRHEAKTKAIAAGRRFGKTVMAGATALSAASAGGRVAWIVPSYRNGRPLWRWAEAAVGSLVRNGRARINRSERTIEFPGTGGFLGIYSADNDSSIRGEWFNLAILDEAAQIAEETWTDVVQPTLADANGDAILISTPKGKNWFWREWQRGIGQMDGEYASFTAPSSANPNPAIRRAAELAADRVPPATYRQEWLAEFVSESENPFDPSWWEEARFNAAEPANDATCVARWISWDTALEDTEAAAYSACVVGELTADYRLFIREVWRDKLTFPNLVSKIRQVALDYAKDEYRGQPKLQSVIIESKVSGISAYQTLTEAGDLPVPVMPFKPQGSKEQRAELAAVWCKQGCVWLPTPSPDVRWLSQFESEVFSFPDSPNADQVDSFSQLILYVSRYLSTGRDARRQAAELLAQEAASVR